MVEGLANTIRPRTCDSPKVRDCEEVVARYPGYDVRFRLMRFAVVLTTFSRPLTTRSWDLLHDRGASRRAQHALCKSDDA